MKNLPRSLGSFGPRGGATLVCVGGIHGNEPSGVIALQRVVRRLTEDPTGLVGRFATFVGNRAGLAAGDRFLDADMNRVWTGERLERVRGGAAALLVEEREMLELADELDAELAAAPRARLFDLHSTSGGGPAFVMLDDSLANRALALALPVPHVLGLEEEVIGTLLGFFNERGVTSIGFEAGQHDAPESADRAEAAVWLLLEATGVLARGARPEPAAGWELLSSEHRARAGLVEVTYRHDISPEDRFAMHPGFTGFQPVRRGQVLADDARGPVASPQTALLLMPLYQARGNDGFFLVRRVHPVWLSLSARLRRSPVHRALHWLPGVRRDAAEAGVFLVDVRRARWLARQVFHLLGYRRRSIHGDVMEMVRRETTE